MKFASKTLVTGLIAIAQIAGAATVANWKQLNGGATIPLSGATTNGPVYGDGSPGSATSSFIAGRFGTVGSPLSFTLAEGDTLTVNGSLVLTGGGGGDSDYRFGIFNDGGQFAANNSSDWTAGWMHQAGTDLFQARTIGAYISSFGNAAPLSATNVTTGTLNKNSLTPLAFSMSVTRDSATTVDIVSSFTGGGGSFDQVFTANDVTTTNFTYTTFGGLFGGGSSMDQGSFSNVQVNLIPEPSSLGLLGLAGLVTVFRRRR